VFQKFGVERGAGMENFDLEAVYDAEIAPLMEKVIEVCKRNDLPFVAEFV
jgi:hypothetical protein